MNHDATLAWADACTLPTAERPLRVAEFDALFASALQGNQRSTPSRLRLIMDGSPEVEAAARDLADRETACCSFFTFTFSRADTSALLIDIDVPAGQAHILDALAVHAAGVERTRT